MENLIEKKVDIMKFIDNLNVSEDNKNCLKYWVGAKAEGLACDDFISGMALALQNEKKITPEDFITIVMWEEGKRREQPRWKSFLRGICFWRR